MGKLLLGLMLVLATPSSVWAAETITYYHNDALGSPIAATDENGKILWKEDYHPYGSRIRKESTDSNQQWYTGKHHENDIGLTYFGARWYDPAIGRFMAIDPVGFKEGNIQSFNRYAYANNNPYLFVDPDGRIAITASVIAAVVIKELLSEAVEQATGIPMPTAKNAVKYGAKKIIKGKYSKKVLLGENMKDRVIPRAKKDGFDTYKTTPKNRKNYMKRNKKWIKRMVKENREFYTLGKDPLRSKRSPYYKMEKEFLKRKGIEPKRLKD